MKKLIVMDIITALVILLFLYASFSKIFDLWYFRYDLAKQPFPKWMQNILLWAIPFSEIFIAGLLMVKRTRGTGLYLALFLMLLFTGYTAVILLHFFAFVPCGCGGVIRVLSWPQHLVFNLFFVTIITAGIWLRHATLKDKQLQMQV
jgi:putative oxidoreductase